MAITSQPPTQKKSRDIENIDTGCIWIAMLAEIIPELLQIIQDQSPEASQKISHKFSIPTARQIKEAREDMSGFAKLAIALAIKYQNSLNTIDTKESAIAEIKGEIKKIFPDPNQIPENLFDQIKKVIQSILQQETELKSSKKDLGEIPAEINSLINQFYIEWQQHDDTSADNLIKDLDAELGGLTDIEKEAIKKKLKTPSQIHRNLNSLGLDSKKIGNLGDKFKLRTIDAIVSVYARKLQQDKITTNNIKDVSDKIDALNTEKKSADKIIKDQTKRYKQLEEKLQKINSTINAVSSKESREKLLSIAKEHREEQKRVAAISLIKAQEAPELE